MRWNLTFITAFVSALICSTLIIIPIMIAEMIKALPLPLYWVTPLFFITLGWAALFVYRRTSKRRKLQAGLSALFSAIFIAFFLVAFLVVLTITSGEPL